MNLEIDKKKKNLDMTFVFTYNYSWIRDKLLMSEIIVQNFDEYLKMLYRDSNFRFRDNQREGYLMMLEVESLASAVKYSEDLAAISMGFGKSRFKLTETLRNYRPGETKGFYDKIVTADYVYLKNILGYPEFTSIDPEKRESIFESIEQARDFYKQIGMFYKKNNDDLYNCYKHGLRVMSTCTDDKDKPWMLLKFPSFKDGEFTLEGFEKTEVEKEYAEALKTVGLIFTLMNITFQNHRTLYLTKKKKVSFYFLPLKNRKRFSAHGQLNLSRNRIQTQQLKLESTARNG